MNIDSLTVRCRVFVYPITDIGTLCLAGQIIIGTNNKGGEESLSDLFFLQTRWYN